MKTKFIFFTLFFSLMSFFNCNAVKTVCTCNKKDSKGNNIRHYPDVGFDDPTIRCKSECRHDDGLKSVSKQ